MLPTTIKLILEIVKMNFEHDECEITTELYSTYISNNASKDLHELFKIISECAFLSTFFCLNSK